MTSSQQPIDRHDAEDASRRDDTGRSGGGVRGALNELLGRGEHERHDARPDAPAHARDEQLQSEPAHSEPAHSEAARPEAARPEAARPEAAHPDAAHPEPAHAEPDPADARTDPGYADQARAAAPAAPDEGRREPVPGELGGTAEHAEHAEHAERDERTEKPSPEARAEHADVAGQDSDGRERLVSRQQAESYASRWDAVKGDFVDEPRQAVRNADVLVGELLDELQALFRDQRQDIERGLDADETSTEDLRLALRRYRSFFDRLLSI